jgi:hypothetical protein
MGPDELAEAQAAAEQDELEPERPQADAEVTLPTLASFAELEREALRAASAAEQELDALADLPAAERFRRVRGLTFSFHDRQRQLGIDLFVAPDGTPLILPDRELFAAMPGVPAARWTSVFQGLLAVYGQLTAAVRAAQIEANAAARPARDGPTRPRHRHGERPVRLIRSRPRERRTRRVTRTAARRTGDSGDGESEPEHLAAGAAR